MASLTLHSLFLRLHGSHQFREKLLRHKRIRILLGARNLGTRLIEIPQPDVFIHIQPRRGVSSRAEPETEASGVPVFDDIINGDGEVVEDGGELLQGFAVGGVVLGLGVHRGGEEVPHAVWAAVGNNGVDIHVIKGCDYGVGCLALGGRCHCRCSR